MRESTAETFVSVTRLFGQGNYNIPGRDAQIFEVRLHSPHVSHHLPALFPDALAPSRRDLWRSHISQRGPLFLNELQKATGRI